MSVRHSSSIEKPDGSNIEKKRDIIYLGGLISCDGRATREVSRRLGEGRGVFKSLDKLWSNSSLNWHRKVAIFNACVTSKVMWSLESCWLLQADRVRLDAFQAYGLRRIFRILPSYFSRVSNLSVRERAYQSSFCSLLENRQVRLFNKIQSLPCTNFTKRLVCDTNGMPKLWHNRRSRGRPCQIWSTSVYRLIHPT